MSSLVNDVKLNLAGRGEVSLRPTLAAATAISRQFDGFIGAFQALANLNLEVVTFLVRQGVSENDLGRDELPDVVWRSDITTLTRPLARYLGILQHGGRDPDAVAKETDGQPVGNL